MSLAGAWFVGMLILALTAFGAVLAVVSWWERNWAGKYGK